MLPNFIHIGTPKSGSGTLSRILRMHPQVYTPRPKELNFFNSPDYAKGVDWYAETYFSGYAGEPISCDKSIGYASGDVEQTLSRIVETLGRNIRVLITVRHPVDRAYSQYCMARFKGQFETLSFKDAVEDALSVSPAEMIARMHRVDSGAYYSDPATMSAYRRANYIVPGLYASLYARCRETFGPDNVLLVFTEDMASDLTGQIQRLTGFLGIDPIPVAADLRANEATSLRYPWLRRVYNRLYGLAPVRAVYDALGLAARRRLRRTFLSWNYQKNESVPPPHPEGQTRLQSYYADEILALSALSGRDLAHWVEKYQGAREDK